MCIRDRDHVVRAAAAELLADAGEALGVVHAEARRVAVIDAAPQSPVVRAVQQLADIIEQRGMESS